MMPTLEVVPVPDMPSAEFCSALATFCSTYDRRNACTAEEISSQYEIHCDEPSREMAIMCHNELCGMVQASFAGTDTGRTKCWLSARWFDCVDDNTVRRAVEDLLAWGGVPDTAEGVAYVYQDRENEVRLWEDFGFQDENKLRFFERPLNDSNRPPLITIDGVSTTTLAERPDLIKSVYAIWLEGIRSIPGEEESHLPDFETWRMMVDNTPSCPPSARTVAMNNGEVIGYSSLGFPLAVPERADTGLLAVREDWRGRGVGRMLKHLAINTATDAGCKILKTDNHEGNEPILRMNSTLGFEEVTPCLVMKAPKLKQKSSRNGNTE